MGGGWVEGSLFTVCNLKSNEAIYLSVFVQLLAGIDMFIGHDSISHVS